MSTTENDRSGKGVTMGTGTPVAAEEETTESTEEEAEAEESSKRGRRA